MNYEAQLTDLWNHNQRYIAVGLAMLFTALAFSKRKGLACFTGIISAVLMNLVFSQEITDLSINVNSALRSFLYSRGMPQLAASSDLLTVPLVHTSPFWIVLIVSWSVKKCVRGIKRLSETIKARQMKRAEHKKQKKIDDVKSGIAKSAAYRLNIIPFLNALCPGSKRSKDYARLIHDIQRFNLKQIRKCRQLDLDAKKLDLPERTTAFKE